MLSRILVPMDDPDPAGNALAYAFENFTDAEVTVLHVVGAPSMLMGGAAGLALEDDLDEAARERAEPVFERARKRAADHDREVGTVVGVGHPARNILDRADGYDTVILGSHGADWNRASRRFLVGNVADTVVRRASVPVTIVR